MVRRLAAILSVDVVGYSRLMGADEAGTLAAINKHRKELIEPKALQYHGRIVKLMGDGALMEFPSAVDAVSFAVEVQCAMRARNRDVPKDRQILYRIGINIGDIIIEDGDIFGDGVNIAARLEGLAEPGGICVARNVVSQVTKKLDLNFENLGEKKVKNIAEPVSTYRVTLDDKARALVTDVRPTPSARTGWQPYAAAGLAMLLVVVGIVWWQPWDSSIKLAPAETTVVDKASLPLSDRPSIAVLPFTNMSGNPEQEYFADGITEDLITDISKVSGLFVIARNSTFLYKNQPVDVRDVAHELGVRYVLEGSVRRAGDQVRINAQLIDADTGGHVWAERYDGAIADVFALQDKVTQQIVSALAVTLTPMEKKRLNEADKVDPAAYDLYLKGQSRVSVFSPESNAEARDFFHQAIVKDPSFGRAHAGLALAHAVDALLGFTKDTKGAREQALKHAHAALALNSTAPQVHFALAYVYSSQHQMDKGLEELRRAITLDPNYADGYALMGSLLAHAGKPKEAIEAIRKAMQLSPRHGFVYNFVLANAYFVMGRYEKAIPILQDVLKRNRAYQQARLLLIAILGLRDRIEDAEWEVAEVLTALPDFSIKAEASRVRYQRAEDHARYIDGLRKAGLPQ